VPQATAAVDFEGFAAPGTPAKLNKVGVLKVGSPRARNVLILNPGTSSSAAYFAPLAKDISGGPVAGRCGPSSGGRTCSRTIH
jgi:hypothetical protein